MILKKSLVFILLLSPTAGFAHSVFDDYIHHGLNLKIDSNNIDITVDLFFHAHRSETERGFMDSNWDGHIMPSEIRKYLKLKMGQFKKGIQLSIDGQPLRVMALYRPDLKLHNVSSVGDHPHSLKLYYFARTPRQLGPCSIITLEDKLWRSTPGLFSLSVHKKWPLHPGVHRRPAPLLGPRYFSGRRVIQIPIPTGSGQKFIEYLEKKEDVTSSDTSKLDKNKKTYEIRKESHNKGVKARPSTDKPGGAL